MSEKLTYKDLEQRAEEEFKKDVEEEIIKEIKEKKQEIRVAKRILNKLKKQYDELIERAVE